MQQDRPRQHPSVMPKIGPLRARQIDLVTQSAAAMLAASGRGSLDAVSAGSGALGNHSGRWHLQDCEAPLMHQIG